MKLNLKEYNHIGDFDLFVKLSKTEFDAAQFACVQNPW